MTPAIELEGYYVGKNTFTGNDRNETLRIAEHDFLVTYPVKTGVFLIHAVANLNLSDLPRLHPYVGGGLGAGILSISNADARQVAPPEAGINHFNSKPTNTDSTFAAQVKAGLNFALSDNLNIFGEYRWLYLSSSSYTFGSTIIPGHPTTSNWNVGFGAQNYNLGALGIRCSV